MPLPAPFRSIRWFVVAIGLASIGASSSALAGSTVEEFDNEVLKDAAATTADWNTAAGKLQLRPFQGRTLGRTGPHAYPIGYGRQVKVIGSTAYVGASGSGSIGGLLIADISDPMNPEVLSYTLVNTGFGLDVVGDRVYLANHFNGLRIFDTSDPSHPVELGLLDTPDVARDVVVRGNLAYVADGFSYADVGGSGALLIIDVSNPAVPVLVAECPIPSDGSGTPNAQGVDVQGRFAYVACFESGLKIIDISNPASPEIVGGLNTPGFARQVVVRGNIAYVTDNAPGLLLIDVSDPTSPVLLGSMDTPGEAHSLAVEGTTVYVGDGGPGVQIIDAADPVTPALVGNLDTPYLARGVAVAGPFAYFADLDSGLVVAQIATLVPPAACGGVETPAHANEVKIVGTTAYVADRESGLQIVDVVDPANPVALGSFNTTGLALDADVVGSTAYVADGSSGLQIVDAGNPSAPALLGTFDTPDAAGGVVVEGDLAYVADGRSFGSIGDPLAAGLQIIDVGDPSQPAFVGRCILPGSAVGVALEGTLIFLACSDAGLQIVDVGDPANPILIGGLDTPGSAQRVAVAGTRVYVTDGSAGLHVIDAGDPTQPVFMGTYDTPGSATGLWVVGTTAYVADGAGGLQIIDALVPSAPVLVASSSVSSAALGVEVHGVLAYVADDEAGLRVVEVMQNRFDLTANVGQSLKLNGVDPVSQVRLLATETPNIAWELTANGGASWHAVVSGGDFVPVPSGTDLRWRAKLAPTSPIATATPPEVSRVEIEWMTVLDADESITPARFGLRDPAPNPMRSSTRIVYQVPAAGGAVRIVVFDVHGRAVRTLVNGVETPGEKVVTWSGRDDRGRELAPGLYLVRMQAPGFESVRRLMLAR